MHTKGGNKDVNIVYDTCSFRRAVLAGIPDYRCDTGSIDMDVCKASDCDYAAGTGNHMFLYNPVDSSRNRALESRNQAASSVTDIKADLNRFNKF